MTSAVPTDPGPGGSAPTQPPAAKRRPWWRPPARLPYSPEPGGHLTRNLAYELSVALVTASFAGLVLFGALGGRFEDAYFRLRAHAPTSGQVTVVNIDEEALYLWNPELRDPETTPRALLAIVIRFLHAAGARVVALDLLLDEAGPEDALLAAAARSHGAVLVAERYQPLTSGHAFVPGTVGEIGASAYPAFANLIEEESSLFSGDALVRRAPLVRRVSRVQLQGVWPGNLVGAVQDERALMPSLALAAAWWHKALQASPEARFADLEAALNALCEGPDPACREGTLGLPALPGPLHAPLAVNWRGPTTADGVPTVRAAEILRVMGATALMEQLGQPMPVTVPDPIRRLVEGRVVVVGRTTTGLDPDRFVTPYAFPTYRAADMPGVRVQAQLIDQLLSGRHLRVMWGGWAWLAAAGLAAMVVRTRGRVLDGLHALGWIGVAIGLPIAGYGVFRLTDGLMLNPAPAMIGTLAALFLVHLRGWAIEDSLDATEFDDLFGVPTRRP